MPSGESKRWPGNREWWLKASTLEDLLWPEESRELRSGIWRSCSKTRLSWM